MIARLRDRFRALRGRASRLIHPPDPLPAQGIYRSSPGRVLLGEPLTVVTMASPAQPLGLASVLGPELADRPALFLLGLSWEHQSAHIARLRSRMIQRYRRRFPRHRFIALCNDAAEQRALAALGVPAWVVNHNICADPRIFRPLPASRLYDAVHVARMTPWKRHLLAREIPWVAHVFGREMSLSWERSLGYLEECRRAMPGHSFLNAVGEEDFVRLKPPEVNAVMNQSAVGLCLSAAEGAMFASIEYLLAGLPIVSTPSRGGRDHFFDPDYCLIVPSEPAPIAAAAASLARRAIPPDEIRSRTLARIASERARFLELLDEAVPGAAAGLAEAAKDADGFFASFYAWHRFEKFRRELDISPTEAPSNLAEPPDARL